MMKAYKKLGNYKQALYYADIYITTNNTLFKEQQTNATTTAEVKFNSEKKQLQIEKLNKEKELQGEINRRQKIIIIFACLGVELLLIIALIIFRSLRLTHRQKKIIEKEKQRSEELLLNILPAEVAEELKEKGYADAKHFDEVTVLFTDFKGFTAISEKLSPHELVKEIDECFKEFDRITEKFGIEKIKTIGDSYMCAGGLPVETKSNPEDTVMAALEMRNFMLAKRKQYEADGKAFFEIRIGVHTGPVVAGIVGIKKFAYDIWGDTVNIASRMESSGEPGKVNISGSTYELVKDKFKCSSRGKIEAKNKGMVEMYFVESF
jgi:adenylate cyclase